MTKHPFETAAASRDLAETIIPPPSDLEIASSSLDSAALALINTADQCAKSCDTEQDLINLLEDHGHGLLRSAAALRARRLRRQHPKG